MRMRHWLSAICLSILTMTAAEAARFVLAADNVGALTGTGRSLSFNLPAVTGEIRAASLELDLNYSAARDLRFTLVDGSGFVELPLGSLSSLSALVSMNGHYRITDTAIRSWLEAAPTVSGNLSNLYPARAFQFGPGGLCFNLLGRYLEFDVDRKQPLSLVIGRLGGGTGSGSITAARLVIETDSVDQMFATGLEESAEAPVRCKRPSFDVVFNGGNASFALSPLVLLRFVNDSLVWTVEQLDPPMSFEPLTLGDAPDLVPYVGRFGGRSRSNLGFWDPANGLLTFTTGAGARTLSLEGDWLNTAHQVMPGDYDGDGTTDLAMAFLGGNNRWVGRIRFSRSDRTLDLPIDPRDFSGAFTSGEIGFGQGQDADRNGADEITLYFRQTPAGVAMRYGQIVVNADLAVDTLFSNAWGQTGDRLVLGKWLEASSGNQFGMMVVRPGVTGLEWYLFPNQTPVNFGLNSDQPLSINIDLDTLNDIAVYRRSDRTLRAIRSSDGQMVTLGPFGADFEFALAHLLGTTAPLQF